MCCYSLLLGDSSTSCETHLGRDLGSLCLVSSDFAHIPFLCWFCFFCIKSQWRVLCTELFESNKWTIEHGAWAWGPLTQIPSSTHEDLNPLNMECSGSGCQHCSLAVHRGCPGGTERSTWEMFVSALWKQQITTQVNAQRYYYFSSKIHFSHCCESEITVYT